MKDNLITYSYLEKTFINSKCLDHIYGSTETCLKRYNIVNLAKIVLCNKKHKNIIEFGVARGDTIKLLYDVFNDDYSTFYLFDTFEGLPKSTFNDILNCEGSFCFSLENVKLNVGNHNNIKYIKGLVENTLRDNLPDFIDFAHIDCDLYSPTYHILKNIIPRMSDFSMIIIDDYKCDKWIGVKKACNEIESEFNVKFELVCNESLLTQAFLIINKKY